MAGCAENCASAKILARPQKYSEGALSTETPTETHLDVLLITLQNWLFKTAKPLFIGSIPIAASNA